MSDPLLEKFRQRRANDGHREPCIHRGPTIRVEETSCCGRIEFFHCPARGRETRHTECVQCVYHAAVPPPVRTSAPILLCVRFADYRERNWHFFREPILRAGWRIEFADVDERGPLAAIKEKVFDIGVPDAIVQWDEHGCARSIASWRECVAWAYERGVVPLMMDFGYVSHYEQFMFDVYGPDGSSMIDVAWATISTARVDWDDVLFAPRDRRRRVLRGYKDATLKPRLIEEPYVCLWLQQYASLSRFGERHNDELVAAAATQAKRLGLHLAVKTAPSTPEHEALTDVPEDVLVFRHEDSDRDINQRLAVHAEYCLVISSSITNEFVLNGLPVVALGRSWFNGKGIFYEPATWADLPAKAPAIDQLMRNRWLRWWLSRQFASRDAGPALKRIVRQARRHNRASAERPGSSVTCVYAPDAQTEAVATRSLQCTREALPDWKTIVAVDAASPAFLIRALKSGINLIADGEGAPPRMGRLLAASLAQAEGPYVFTIEHDCFIDRDQAERAVRLMDTLPARVAGLYLQSVTTEGQPTYPWTNDWPHAQAWEGRPRFRRPAWSTLSCTIWRASALKHVRWDRVPELEYVDGYICKQLTAMGYCTLMTDRVHAIHLPHTGRKSLAGQARVLAIGCDRHWASLRGIRFGWNGEPGLDVRGAVPGALPFDDASFREIWIGRLLSDLDDQQHAVFLAEAARVLRPGGRLHVNVHDERMRMQLGESPLKIVREAEGRIKALAPGG